ncbi:hypothetical protein SCLCIDRAFT_1220052 [Scleroderma citrinum Foug A]|uniref:Uncharacterized protein n=1 Tax=Scleroderma citrinum Foug A TaxID=1036808 RepID=A0A0C3D7Q7_9AGAM|nr:hypothetical protein SCLCIDRAFT_1220052 [Scleroderma citrinum Foug A]
MMFNLYVVVIGDVTLPSAVIQAIPPVKPLTTVVATPDPGCLNRNQLVVEWGQHATVLVTEWMRESAWLRSCDVTQRERKDTHSRLPKKT